MQYFNKFNSQSQFIPAISNNTIQSKLDKYNELDKSEKLELLKKLKTIFHDSYMMTVNIQHNPGINANVNQLNQITELINMFQHTYRKDPDMQKYLTDIEDRKVLQYSNKRIHRKY